MKHVSRLVIIFGVSIYLISCTANIKKFTHEEEGRGAILNLMRGVTVPLGIGNVFFSYTYITGNKCVDPEEKKIYSAKIEGWDLDIYFSACKSESDTPDPDDIHIAKLFAQELYKAKKETQKVFPEKLTGYKLSVFLLPVSTGIDLERVGFSFSDITHEYYVQLPKPEEDFEKWLATNTASIMHEYFHSLIKLSSNDFINNASEEAAAYVFTWYLIASLYEKGTASFTYLGKPIKSSMPQPVQKNSDTIGDSNLDNSLHGKDWGIRSIVYVLGTSEMNMSNSLQRKKLLVLCAYLIKSRLDITKQQDLSWIANFPDGDPNLPIT